MGHGAEYGEAFDEEYGKIEFYLRNLWAGIKYGFLGVTIYIDEVDHSEE